MALLKTPSLDQKYAGKLEFPSRRCFFNISFQVYSYKEFMPGLTAQKRWHGRAILQDFLWELPTHIKILYLYMLAHTFCSLLFTAGLAEPV